MDIEGYGVLAENVTSITCYYSDQTSIVMSWLLWSPFVTTSMFSVAVYMAHDFLLTAFTFWLHWCSFIITAWQVLDGRIHEHPYCKGYFMYTFPSGIPFVVWFICAAIPWYVIMWKRPIHIIGLTLIALVLAVVTGGMILLELSSWWEVLVTAAIAVVLCGVFFGVMRIYGAYLYDAWMDSPIGSLYGLENHWIEDAHFPSERKPGPPETRRWLGDIPQEDRIAKAQGYPPRDGSEFSYTTWNPWK